MEQKRPTNASDRKRSVILPAVLPAGTKLGKYEIVEHIGTGGMAVIYKAYDTLLERFVAIKQIASNYAADAKWCEHFRKEAQMIARVGSVRNVVAVYELVENRAGLFLVMEYVEGRSLESLIKQGPLPVQDALEILWNTCLGLRRVHAAGIIHRDLKPGNILVPADRKAKITDFGVAAHTGGKTSMALGTTKYMAPELFSGQEVDGRCDIYSLGFIGFEMLAGPERFGRLFQDVLRDPRSESLRWMNWHTRISVKLPPLHELNSEVPRPLSQIITRMTAKKLDERFASIEEVISQIKKHFAAEGVEAAQRTAGASAGEWARPRRVRRIPEEAGQAAAVPAKPERTRILLAADQMDTDDEAPTSELPVEPGLLGRHRKALIWTSAALGALLFGLVGVLILVSTGVFADKRPRELCKAGVRAFQERQYAEAADQWRKVLAIDEELETKEGQYAYMWLPAAQGKQAMAEGRWDEAVRLFREAKDRGASADKIRKWIAEAETRKTVERALEAYRAYLDANAFDLAREQIDVIAQADPDNPELAALRAKVDEAETEHRYRGYLAHAKVLLSRKKYDEARRAYRDARQLKDTPEVAELLKAVDTREEFDKQYEAGEQAMAMDDFAAAARYYENALERARSLVNSRIPLADLDRKFKRAKARALLKEARELKRQGKMNLALAKFRESLKYEATAEAQQEVARHAEMRRWKSLVAVGNEALRNKQWRAALEAYQQAEAIEKTDILSVRIDQCRYHLKLAEGDALAAEKKWDEARAAYEQARQLGDPSVVDAKLKELQALQDYAAKLRQGDEFLKVGQFGQARRAYKEAQRLRKTAEIQVRLDEVDYAEFLTRGKEALAAGQYDSAVAWLRRAIAVKQTEEVRRLLDEAQRRARGTRRP